MARRLDDVVGTPHEPEVAVGIPLCHVARQVPAIGEAFAVALILAEIAAEHRGPAGLEREFALESRFGHDPDPGRGALDDHRFDARQRLAHRSGLHRQGGEIGDRDAASLRLPPIVVERPAERLLAPHHCFGIERLADACEESQRGQIISARDFDADLHQHADRRRRRVPDADALASDDRVPALGVELHLVDDARHAAYQRGDHAIGHSRHPPRVGRAPEDVAVMKVECIPGRDRLGDDRVMDQQRALGPSGRSAGEVHQGAILAVGRRHGISILCPGEQRR